MCNKEFLQPKSMKEPLQNLVLFREESSKPSDSNELSFCGNQKKLLNCNVYVRICQFPQKINVITWK